MTRFPAIVPGHTRCARAGWPSARWLWSRRRAVILFVRGTRPPGPDEALDPFLAAWTRGDDRGAAAITTDPRAAGAARVANRRGLDGAGVHASAGAVDRRDSARATVLMRWDVPGIGVWTYRTRVALSARRPLEGALAPDGGPSSRDRDPAPGTVRDPAARAPILDRQGRTLVSARAVVRVGIDRATVNDGTRRRPLAGVVDVDPPSWRAPPAGPGPSSSSRP